MAVIQVSESNFEEIKAGGNTVLLDFFATWCGPCKRMVPIIEEIAEEHPDVTVGKVNIEEEPALAEKFGVMSVPTLIVLKDGNLANKAVGGHSKAEILKLL